MSLGFPETKIIGPPVEWSMCLYCGKSMGVEEERWRIEVGGRVGIGHRGCRDEILNRMVVIEV